LELVSQKQSDRPEREVRAPGKGEHFTGGKDGRGQPSQPNEREALENLQ